VARLEMKVTQVDLSAIARELLDRLARDDPGRRVAVQVADDVKVMGDPALLRIVLRTLAENAWKFTAARTDGRIEFGNGIVNGERVFHISDNGVGFDMRYAHKLFGIFQRLHGQNEFEGTGIGLATAQRIVHRHGGRIWAEGELGRGATFRFTLPEGFS
jgi:light-regulated signal transduction histidine kinase (bacteriophytochrome)